MIFVLVFCFWSNFKKCSKLVFVFMIIFNASNNNNNKNVDFVICVGPSFDKFHTKKITRPKNG